MTISVTVEQILRLAPSAQRDYVEAFRNGQPVLDHFGISATPLRVAHFMAQILQESGGAAGPSGGSSLHCRPAGRGLAGVVHPEGPH